MKVFWYLGPTMFHFVVVSRLLFLMGFGSESGCPGLGITKINFRRSWHLMIPGSIFHDFGWRWNQFPCGSLHFWYTNLLGMLGGFTLTSWGTPGRSWDVGEHKKGHVEVQAWILIDFFVDLGTSF